MNPSLSRFASFPPEPQSPPHPNCPEATITSIEEAQMQVGDHGAAVMDVVAQLWTEISRHWDSVKAQEASLLAAQERWAEWKAAQEDHAAAVQANLERLVRSETARLKQQERNFQEEKKRWHEWRLNREMELAAALEDMNRHAISLDAQRTKSLPVKREVSEESPPKASKRADENEVEEIKQKVDLLQAAVRLLEQQLEIKNQEISSKDAHAVILQDRVALLEGGHHPPPDLAPREEVDLRASTNDKVSPTLKVRHVEAKNNNVLSIKWQGRGTIPPAGGQEILTSDESEVERRGPPSRRLQPAAIVKRPERTRHQSSAAATRATLQRGQTINAILGEEPNARQRPPAVSSLFHGSIVDMSSNTTVEDEGPPRPHVAVSKRPRRASEVVAALRSETTPHHPASAPAPSSASAAETDEDALARLEKGLQRVIRR